MRPDQVIRETPECKAARATGQKLDEAFIQVIAGPVYTAWQYIAADAGRCSNSEAIELSIDADRLWYGMPLRGDAFKRAVHVDEAVDEAIKVHGYRKVLRYLSAKIKL